jgi:outer membrane immunogenic protein
MRRQSFGLLSVALAIVASAATSALAADLPVPAHPAPAYYPPPPAHYNWSGFYFGGHVGVGLVRDVVTDTTTTALLTAGTKTNVSPYALIGGPQAGLNLQFGPAVVGVEGTWTSSYLSGNQTVATLVPNTQEESRTAPHWYATATGKLGFAANDWLFYAKGGGAWMHVDYTQITLLGGALVGGQQQLISDNRSGWTAGLGIEYALNENLSAKLEYDFLDFGTKNYNFTTINGGAGLPVSIQSQTHMITVGMNYRFYFGGFGQY